MNLSIRGQVIFSIIMLGMMLIMGGGVPAVAADNGHKVLIVNSNSQVEQYALMEKVFRESSTKLEHSTLDLESSGDPKTLIYRAIRDRQPDLIFCIGTRAHAMVGEVAPTEKRIFASVINWKRFPVGNVTFGISHELMSDMQFTMFRMVFKDISSIGILFDDKVNKEWVAEAAQAAQRAGMKLVSHPIAEEQALSNALDELLPKVDALWLIADPVVLASRESVELIFRKADAAHKPVLAYNDLFASNGASMVMTADLKTIAIQAASLAEEILLSNHLPSEPVQTPAGTSIVLNLRKIKEHNVPINPDALSLVNKILE